jgi:hypothetical protein
MCTPSDIHGRDVHTMGLVRGDAVLSMVGSQAPAQALPVLMRACRAIPSQHPSRRHASPRANRWPLPTTDNSTGHEMETLDLQTKLESTLSETTHLSHYNSLDEARHIAR